MTHIDCDGPLSAIVSRDNTPLRNVYIIRLTERISVMHRYSCQRYELCVGKAYIVSRISFCLSECRHIPDDKLDNIQSIMELASDPEGDWYLSEDPFVGEDIPIPDDVEVGGDNDVNQ
jgi:hypothetical protein